MKGLSERTAARLQRWRLSLEGFDFEIEYVRTDRFGHADALSRLVQEVRAAAQDPSLEEVVADIAAVCEEELPDVVCNALQSEETREKVTRETGKDPVLSRVLQRIAGGWTSTRQAGSRAASVRAPRR